MSSEPWSRRRFAEALLRVLGPLALLRELRARDALAAPARLTDGTLRARRIDWEESLRLYAGRA